jgi:hypothetical protein
MLAKAVPFAILESDSSLIEQPSRRDQPAFARARIVSAAATGGQNPTLAARARGAHFTRRTAGGEGGAT